jgi:hypothetical protein
MAQTLKKILHPSDEVEVGTKTVDPVFTMTLDLPPSCLEFVPYSINFPRHLVAGTYSLDPDTLPVLNDHNAVQSRSGSLMLLRMKPRSL